MKFIKRLLSKDFRKMEWEIVGLKDEYKACEEWRKNLHADWLTEKKRADHLSTLIDDKLKQLEDYRKENDELKLKIRDQSEADLLFATLKIVNEIVSKEKPDGEELDRLHQMRDHALSALQGQFAIGLNNNLLGQQVGGLGLNRLFGSIGL